MATPSYSAVAVTVSLLVLPERANPKSVEKFWDGIGASVNFLCAAALSN